jgi:hypothetical protein
MSVEIEKASIFVHRLLQNPTLQNLTPLLREEQILQFLSVNARQLYPTLSSQAFFPGQNWEQIAQYLTEALRGEINKQFLPELEAAVKDNLDFGFVQFLRQQGMPQQRVKDEVFGFISTVAKKPEIRRDLLGPFNAVRYGFVDRYVDEAFDRNEYVYFELTKVQRLKMGKEEIKHFLTATLLLKPAIHVLSANAGKLANDNTGGSVQIQFIEKVVGIIKEKLTVLPEQVIRSALYANGSFLENRSMDATSRMASIFSAMCRNYRPNLKIDRGADSADKSWISVARRNFKFYGYDVKLLDEFYKIAAENGW